MGKGKWTELESLRSTVRSHSEQEVVYHTGFQTGRCVKTISWPTSEMLTWESAEGLLLFFSFQPQVMLMVWRPCWEPLWSPRTGPYSCPWSKGSFLLTTSLESHAPEFYQDPVWGRTCSWCLWPFQRSPLKGFAHFVSGSPSWEIILKSESAAKSTLFL